MIRKEFYRPNPNPDRDIEDRKTRFAALNAFVTERGGWLTSVPGAVEIELQALPGSTLPDEIAERFGYDVREIGETERILPAAIVERFTRRADGELEPLTAESTKPVAETRTHAGICKVRRFGFDLR
jgi:hypothetical protein